MSDVTSLYRPLLVRPISKLYTLHSCILEHQNPSLLQLYLELPGAAVLTVSLSMLPRYTRGALVCALCLSLRLPHTDHTTMVLRSYSCT